MTRPGAVLEEMRALDLIFTSPGYPTALEQRLRAWDVFDPKVFASLVHLAKATPWRLRRAAAFLWQIDIWEIAMAAGAAYIWQGTERWDKDLFISPIMYWGYGRDLVFNDARKQWSPPALAAILHAPSNPGVIAQGFSVEASDQILSFQIDSLDGTPIVLTSSIGHLGAPVSEAQRQAYCLLRWLQSPYVTADAIRASRAERRRLQLTDDQLSEVHVIRLRRRGTDGRPAADDGDEDGVDWKHRWFVRSHWHHYHTKEGTISHWLAPYIKGPDDLPLLPFNPDVFAVVR